MLFNLLHFLMYYIFPPLLFHIFSLIFFSCRLIIKNLFYGGRTFVDMCVKNWQVKRGSTYGNYVYRPTQFYTSLLCVIQICRFSIQKHLRAPHELFHIHIPPKDHFECRLQDTITSHTTRSCGGSFFCVAIQMRCWYSAGRKITSIQIFLLRATLPLLLISFPQMTISTCVCAHTIIRLVCITTFETCLSQGDENPIYLLDNSTKNPPNLISILLWMKRRRLLRVFQIF